MPNSSELLPHKLKADVLIDQSKQMILWNLIFQAEVVEQRLTAGVMSHQDQQASDDRNPAQHGKELFPSNMLLRNLILLIEVTFSTPTGEFTH